MLVNLTLEVASTADCLTRAPVCVFAKMRVSSDQMKILYAAAGSAAWVSAKKSTAQRMRTGCSYIDTYETLHYCLQVVEWITFDTGQAGSRHI